MELTFKFSNDTEVVGVGSYLPGESTRKRAVLCLCLFAFLMWLSAKYLYGK